MIVGAAMLERWPLVATVVAASLDAAGQPYCVLRVWSGALTPGVALHHGSSGAVFKARKWFQLRGPRRATAHALGPGALVATWPCRGP